MASKSFPSALQAANTNQLKVVMEMNLSANADYKHLKGKNKAICIRMLDKPSLIIL